MALQWNQKGNLRGPMGPQGEPGADGKTGAGYRTADIDLQANSTVQLSAIHPSTGIQVGDLLVDPQGDVFPVASVGDGTIQTGTATGQNLRGPQGQQGEQGEPGADGTGVTILGSYDSLGELQEAHPTGNDGDAYMVDGDLYVWSSTDSQWKNVGQIQGPQGPQGVPGTAATIAVGSVTGLDAGASPTVVNSGTSTAARLDFGIPKGDKGDTGDPGHTPQRGVDYWTAEDVETVVEDAKARAVAEMAEIGNVPKKTVTDLVAHAEDAYAQKPIEVRVKGRTVKNLWGAINRTYNGITVNTDDTGLVTVTGQLETPTSWTYLSATVTNIVAGRSITAVCSRGLPDGVYLYVNFRDDGGSSVGSELQLGFNSTSETQKTATVPSGAVSALAGVAVKPGTTLEGSLTFRVMLVDGSEAPDCFTPPASITSVQTGNLVTAGKNLINLDGAEYVKSLSSSSATFGDDGSVTITGATDSRGGCYVKLKSVELPPGSYVASGFTNGNMWLLLTSPNVLNPITSGNHYTGEGYPFRVIMNADQSTAFKIDAPSRVAFSTGDQIAEGVSLTLYPQIELGSTATAYEPPNVTTTPLPEVELRSLPDGTCDELVIGADGTCEVERRLGQRTIDAEHPISVNRFVPVSGTNLPYALVSMFTPFDSASTSVNKTMFSTSWPYTPNLKSRGVYRTWNSTIFVDERFTDKETAASIINEAGGTFVAQVPLSTEPQSPITLPALPAPTFNAYHDGNVPSDTSVEYARDINIVIDNLAKQIAGTAATVAINEATR